MSSIADYLIIGGGIVGLATALALSERFPGAALLVLEKEGELAFHQTGHNSGVIHSGVYYKPGSFKAQFTRVGNRRLVEFCQAQDIAHEICGKVIVATRAEELGQLEVLYQRGLANGVAVERLTAEQVKEREPEVGCLGGIYVPTAGIVDYRQVCRKYAELVRERGGEIRLGQKVVEIEKSAVGYRVITEKDRFETRFLINCAGLQSDRLAKLAGSAPPAKIVPFRGEYYELKPEKRHLVKGLIYPVPNPDFPFLGVHFTRMIDGSVHAGPNAVLSLKREGYGKWDFDWRDFSDAATYPGFWKLAGKHWDEGLKEIWRSLSKAAFVRSLQQLIPVVSAEDIIPTPPGIRAQALRPDGALVDDFLILDGPASLQVCNAPSPAATASLEIGRVIAERIP
ncbi:MAG: L-2-hydroxyglutarate oxidase [Cyanobacteria bacterium RI_101]|nr:L-2-hydroxyglutarate oxidase [Cyanobacteria bacterium RI_101]